MSAPTMDTVEAVAEYTAGLVGRAFAAENARRQADRDPTKLSLSGLGGCTRQAAYSVAGVEPTDVPAAEEARAAMLGTWLHDHLIPGMAEQIGAGAEVEAPVILKAAGLAIPGSLDLAHDALLWDLKSVKEFRLDGVRRNGAYSEHRVQVMSYALARYQAGHDVKWVVWLYVDRSTGEVEVVTERFTNAAAVAVLDRAKKIAWFAANGPDGAPREARGPGLSWACDRCPWLRRCWGEDAEPGRKGAQRVLATREGIEQALGLYDAGRAAIKAGRDDQEFARAILDGVPAGTYGAWRLSRTKAGSDGSAPKLQVKPAK